MTTPDSTPTTLYRLFDRAGKLLYVGIAGNPGRRFEQHRADKLWWGEVADIKVQHFPDRQAAMGAELEAIRAERPVHNIIGNRGHRPGTDKLTNWRTYSARRSTDSIGPPKWFCRDRWGHNRSTDELALVWEADYAAVSDDFYRTDDPHEVFDTWLDAIKGKYQQWVPIYWWVDGISFEGVPFAYHNLCDHDFLSFFTWPHDIDENPVNWLTLPLDHAKSWFIPAATGWTPSPLQSAVDVNVLRVANRAERGYPSQRPRMAGDEWGKGRRGAA